MLRKLAILIGLALCISFLFPMFYLLTGLFGGAAFMWMAKLLGANAQNFWSYLIPAIIVAEYLDFAILFVKAVLFLGAFRLLVNLLPTESAPGT